MWINGFWHNACFYRTAKIQPYEKNNPDQHPHAIGILCAGVSRYIDIKSAFRLQGAPKKGKSYREPIEEL